MCLFGNQRHLTEGTSTHFREESSSREKYLVACSCGCHLGIATKDSSTRVRYMHTWSSALALIALASCPTCGFREDRTGIDLFSKLKP